MSIVGAAKGVGLLVGKDFESRGLKWLVGRAVTSVDRKTALVRGSLLGPAKPRLPIRSPRVADLPRAALDVGKFLQSAHAPGSWATHVVADSHVLRELNELIATVENEIADKARALRLAPMTLNLALGLMIVARFSDQMKPVAARAVFEAGVSLYRAFECFDEDASLYDRFRNSDFDSIGVSQLIGECGVNHAVGLRKFSPLNQVTYPDVGLRSEVWNLTRSNSMALLAMRLSLDGSSKWWKAEDALTAAHDRIRYLDPNEDKRNPRHHQYHDDPIMQASQSVRFAQSFAMRLEAMRYLVETWNQSGLTVSDKLRVRLAMGKSHAYMAKGGAIWWHSYAGSYAIWAFFLYRLGDILGFRRYMRMAELAYGRTQDLSQVRKVEKARGIERQRSLTALDLFTVFT